MVRPVMNGYTTTTGQCARYNEYEMSPMYCSQGCPRAGARACVAVQSSTPSLSPATRTHTAPQTGNRAAHPGNAR